VTPLARWLAALRGSDAAARADAAQRLPGVTTPQTAAAVADALAHALADPEPAVRGHAAAGLAALGDARALPALVRTLGDVPDILHVPHTLATHVLMRQGEAALPHVVPLLLSSDALQRQRAYAVLQAIVMGTRGSAGWQALWLAQGGYNPRDADTARRDAAAGLWAAWVAQQARPP